MLPMVKTDIRNYSLEELTDYFKSIGEPAFRAKQVYEWLWSKSAVHFESMSNISKDLRRKLNEYFEIKPIELDHVQFSKDGTIKSRFRLYDNSFIESVLIPVPDENRFTVCISCQVGCSLSCKFCATGQMKRIRNLDPGEIYDQVVAVNRQSLEHYDHVITNIVYMGMGEPLLTYNNTLKSIQHITGKPGLGMSPKRITVSTAGIAKMIKKLADDGVKFNLALSLHAADDNKRNTIMPINEQNNLQSLVEALKYFYQKTGNRISYEYIAFQGFNDTEDDALKLIKLCKHFPVKVNIIEYNTIDGFDMTKSEENRLNHFAKILRNNNIMVTVRTSRGKDIDAACGQLANKG